MTRDQAFQNARRAVAVIVDDIPENREIIDRYLSGQGYETRCFENGSLAIEHLSQNEADIVLLDWMMPGLDGLETLRAIREHHSSAALPVIMCTAIGEDLSVVAAFNAGANDYITKPVNLPVLRARVEAQLRQRGHFDEVESDRARLDAELTRQRRRLFDRDAPTAVNL